MAWYANRQSGLVESQVPVGSTPTRATETRDGPAVTPGRWRLREGGSRGAPHLQRAAIAGEDALAVGAERHGGDCTGVALEGELHLPRLSVPHPHRLVLAAGDDALAVRTQRHAGDLVRVPLEGGLLLAR